MESLYQSIEVLNLPNHTRIVRILCLTYVIQLSLKDLLGLMKINLKNDIAYTIWSEEDHGIMLQ